MRTLTVKVGRLGYAWHAAHIILAIATGGCWLPVYGAHAAYSAATRPTVQVDVPDGHRIEYRDGWPNVLAPDEYLTPRPVGERLLRAAGCVSPAVIAAAVVAVAVWRS